MQTSTAPRLADTEKPPEFQTELDGKRWARKLENRQKQLDDAWSKFPPGTMLYVSAARGLVTHRRAGVDFKGKASTTVEVSGQDAAKIAGRVSRGEAIVSPLGAMAITLDDALIVHGGPAVSRGERAEADRIAAENAAELERLRAENARLRRADAEAPAAKSDGRPERLAPGKAKAD